MTTQVSATTTGMWIGQPFNPRNNSLNLARLILASSVLFHHSFPLLGREEPIFFGDTIGGWAVIGFFTISGYLIAASRGSKSFGDYLSLRIARIFPAFIACNIFTVVLLAPIAYRHFHGTLDGYLSTGTTPLNYIVNNLGLKMLNYDVAGTPLGVPYPGAWNGSLWSLYYEFVCYLLVGLLACLAIYKRSIWAPLVVWVVSVGFKAALPRLHGYFGGSFDVDMLAKLVPYFMAGAVLSALRKKIGMHWGLGIGSSVAFGLCLVLVDGWGGQLGSIFLAYFILWLGSVVPCPSAIQVHDVSYGMYIYAFQMQQIMAVFGLGAWGYWPYSLVALALTAVLAIASWFIVERPIITRVRDAVNKKPEKVPATQ